MDSGWYEKRQAGFDPSPYDDHAAASHSAAAGACVAAAAAASASPSLHPAVRVSWQGLLPSSNVCIDNFTSSVHQRFLDSGLGAGADLLYFLTHMHTDHTAGLTPSWNRGMLYTSHTTRSLLQAKFGLADAQIITLPLHTPVLIGLNRSGSEQAWVTLIDASTHCPGACMILFEAYFGRVLYTGDMRFDAQCERNLVQFAARYEQLKAEHLRARDAAPSSVQAPLATHASAIGMPDRGLSWLLEEDAEQQHAEVVGASGVQGRATRQQPTPAVKGSPAEFNGDENTPPEAELQPAASEAHKLDAAMPALSPPAALPASSSDVASGILGRIDYLYLDNTFCNPRYSKFYSTASVVVALRAIIRAHSDCDVLLGGDTLGKEDLLVLLSHVVRSRIIVPEARWKILRALAESGAALNTDVSPADLQRLLRMGEDAPAAEDTGNVAAVASVSSAPLPSPLHSPHLWLSSFSPRPHDGFVKLGPKSQVTKFNIHSMNQLVEEAWTRREEEEAKRQQEEEGNEESDDEDEEAEDARQSGASGVDEAEQNRKKKHARTEESSGVPKPDNAAPVVDAMSDCSDPSPAPTAATSSSAAAAIVPPVSGDSLDRPVVGIIVSGWAVDRLTKSKAMGYATASEPGGGSAAGTGDQIPSQVETEWTTDVADACAGPGVGTCVVHALPYSSHSSYSQLRRFVSLIRPAAIRPLTKGDTNPAYLHDLLCSPNAAAPPVIVVPESMTRTTLGGAQRHTSAADVERMRKRTAALTQSVLETSSSFAQLASSLFSTARGGRAGSARGNRAAIAIGLHDAEPWNVADTANAHGACITLDPSQPSQVDLTEADSADGSMPDLEDGSGQIVKRDLKYEAGAIKSDPAAVKAESSAANAAAAAAAHPRIRTWIDLFEVFEHYPEVPIPGLVVPAPSQRHVLSYSYARRKAVAEEMAQAEARLTKAAKGSVARKLPAFLKPQMSPLLMQAAQRAQEATQAAEAAAAEQDQADDSIRAVTATDAVSDPSSHLAAPVMQEHKPVIKRGADVASSISSLVGPRPSVPAAVVVSAPAAVKSERPPRSVFGSLLKAQAKRHAAAAATSVSAIAVSAARQAVDLTNSQEESGAPVAAGSVASSSSDNKAASPSLSISHKRRRAAANASKSSIASLVAAADDRSGVGERTSSSQAMPTAQKEAMRTAPVAAATAAPAAAAPARRRRGAFGIHLDCSRAQQMLAEQ